MTESQYDVVAIGNAIVDVLAQADDGFLAAHDIAKGAMTLIEEPRAHAIYAAMGPAVEISGGSAANTMVGLAGLGGRAAFIGKVRNDQLGEVFAHDIRAAGVHFATPPATEGPATARCFILVTPDAQRSMNTFLGVSSLLEPSDLDPTLIAAGRTVYLEGYLFDRPEAKDAFYRAAAIAHGSGREVALTLSDAFCVGRHRAAFQHLVESEVDILFANEAEITALYEVDGFDAALQIVRRKCRLAALTRSAAGSVIVSGEEVHVVPAEPVAKVVDTTGAGDLFAAGFLFGLARGRDLGTCGRFGSLAAAEIISHLGARPETSLNALATGKGLL
ncbi:MAG: adenosine kinase [Alphaproteobacteria bacterium]|nr:adenosine kinase [Alphaproteobacteria bacterium]